MLGRRVAVTGIGVVAPAGIGKDAFWRGLLSPAPNGFRQVDDWDPTPYFDNPKEARRSDRVSQFTLAAAAEALEQAGEISADPARRGTFVGTGVGGIGTLEEQIEVRLSKGERRVSPFLVPMMMANAPAATISMRYGWQGPCENTVTACAAGTHAIGNAARMVADGRCDVVMAGGAEAPFTPTAVAGFGNMTALSNSGDSRPFDANATASSWPREPPFWSWRPGNSPRRARHDPWRGARLRLHRRRPPHHGPVAGWCRCRHVHAVGHGRRRHHARSGQTHQRAWHVDRQERRCRSRGRRQGVRHRRLGPVGDLNQGHHRPCARGCRCARGGGGVARHAARQGAAHGGPHRTHPELPAINIVEGGPADWEPGPSLSNSFGFGGHNGTLVLGPA